MAERRGSRGACSLHNRESYTGLMEAVKRLLIDQSVLTVCDGAKT